MQVNSLLVTNRAEKEDRRFRGNSCSLQLCVSTLLCWCFSAAPLPVLQETAVPAWPVGGSLLALAVPASFLI